MTLDAAPVLVAFLEKCQWANVEIFDMNCESAD